MAGWSSARVPRALVGVSALGAIGYEIGQNAGEAAFSLADYLSYFTVQTNLFAAVILIGGAVVDPDTRRWAWLRGAAAALYLVVTGLVYAFLLAPSLLSLTGPWNNTVVHRIVPIFMLLDWLSLTPRRPVRFRAALIWVAYPVVFLCYSLVRGAATGFYPYAFLDPGRSGGYGRVAAFSAMLLAGIVMLSALLAGWTRLRRR